LEGSFSQKMQPGTYFMNSVVVFSNRFKILES
jgi:hypothetical protein